MGKIIVFYILIFTLLDNRREDKRFWPSGIEHFQNSVSPKFIPESNFSLLLSFQNIWTEKYFRTICLLFLCPDFFLHFGDDSNIYLVLSSLFLEKPPC
jgi:hypothetical protein